MLISGTLKHTRVTQTIYHLLRHRLLHTEDGGSAPMLEVLRRTALIGPIEAFFDIAGYRHSCS